MSIEHTDAGGVTQSLNEKFQDLAVGGVPISVLEKENIFLKPDDELTGERKYGDCYIFDYQKFKEKEKSRPGSENDVARLKHDFSALNFNVYADYLNLTKAETLDVLKEAAKKDHTLSKYFVCCFLTHGKEGELLMFDKRIKIDDILQCFSRSSCETLADKPKIFIFQACRGSCCELGVPFDSTDFGGLIKENPDYLDFLIVYSTYEGKVSFKTKDPSGNHNNHGSYFIDELCRTLEQFSEDLDLLQILTIANYRVAYLFEKQRTNKEEFRSKQMPGFTSRLRNDVKFNRKIKMFESPHTQYFDYRRKKTSLGLKSIEAPLEDKKMYNIQKCKRIKFLLLLNTRDNFERDLTYSIANLWASLAVKGYQKEEKRNWSEKELRNFLTEVSKRDFSTTDCFICFIICKAKGDYLYDVDGNKFLMQNIVEQFTGEKCCTLIQKPKIFVFLLSSPAKKSWWPCVCAESTDSGTGSTIPVHADILNIVITTEESQQLQDVVEKFRNIFGRNCGDFLSQLTKLNDELVRDYGFYSASSKNLSTFSFNSTLTKTLIIGNTECKGS